MFQLPEARWILTKCLGPRIDGYTRSRGQAVPQGLLTSTRRRYRRDFSFVSVLAPPSVSPSKVVTCSLDDACKGNTDTPHPADLPVQA